MIFAAFFRALAQIGDRRFRRVPVLGVATFTHLFHRLMAEER